MRLSLVLLAITSIPASAETSALRPLIGDMPDLNPVMTNLLSGFLGALFGGWVAGRYMIWQTREIARHDLRSIVIRMSIHVQHCKGIAGNRTESWTVYMEKAVAAYQRYRALLSPWQRPCLDKAWTAFQGTDPNGDTPYAYAPMMEFAECLDRTRKVLAMLN